MASWEACQPPPKAHVFYFTAPKDVTVDDLVNALEEIVGRYGLDTLMHQGGYKFCAVAATAAAARKITEKGAVIVNGVSCPVACMGPQVVYVTVYRLNPVVSNADLAAALKPYGKVLNVSQPTWKSIQHVKTGMKLVKMEMAKAVPNFMSIRGFKAQFEYKGVRRVCARCGQSGHQVSDCKTPWCGRCSVYGHGDTDCNAQCRRCKGNHATADCLRPRSYADAASNFSEGHRTPPTQQALESTSDFPELPRASASQREEESSGGSALGVTTTSDESPSDSQEMELEGCTSPAEEVIAAPGEATSSSLTDTSLFTSHSSTESSDIGEQPHREPGPAPANNALPGALSGSRSRRKEHSKPGTSSKPAAGRSSLASKSPVAGHSISVPPPTQVKDPRQVAPVSQDADVLRSPSLLERLEASTKQSLPSSAESSGAGNSDESRIVDSFFGPADPSLANPINQVHDLLPPRPSPPDRLDSSKRALTSSSADTDDADDSKKLCVEVDVPFDDSEF